MKDVIVNSSEKYENVSIHVLSIYCHSSYDRSVTYNSALN